MQIAIRLEDGRYVVSAIGLTGCYQCCRHFVLDKYVSMVGEEDSANTSVNVIQRT